MEGTSSDFMEAETRNFSTNSNAKAASVRMVAKNFTRAKGQRLHDLRKGRQPAYVDAARTPFNRVLVVPRPLGEIRQHAERDRITHGASRKMKSNAAVVTAGIVTFGHAAQAMFATLPEEQQDSAFLEVAVGLAGMLGTTLESLVVHVDESALHAHFELKGYSSEGVPLSKILTPSKLSETQNLVAEVMQRYCPDIERGYKKWDRIKAGAKFSETVNRSVKLLHQDLPREIAEVELALVNLREEQALLTADIDKRTEALTLTKHLARSLKWLATGVLDITPHNGVVAFGYAAPADNIRRKEIKNTVQAAGSLFRHLAENIRCTSWAVLDRERIGIEARVREVNDDALILANIRSEMGLEHDETLEDILRRRVALKNGKP